MAAVVQTDIVDRAKLSRMIVLRQWLRTWEVCEQCSLVIALAQVEKEAGQEFKVDKNGPCSRGGLCLETARHHWKSMPKVGT